MSKLIDKAFILGFLSGVFLFFVLNCVSCFLSEKQSTHTYKNFGFGFPFFIYNYNSYVSKEGIDQIGLVATILSAIIISFFVGLVFTLVSRKLFPSKSTLK